MGLFNRNKESNAVQINEVNQNTYAYTPFLFPHKKGESVLGNLYFQAIMNMIWKGISNVTINSTKKDSLTITSIKEFVDTNATLLVNQYIRLGYICVFYNDKHEYRLPQDNEIKKDQYGRVINKHAVVYYSPQYSTERKSLFFIAMPLIGRINKLMGTDDYIMDTLGCFGIISGQDIPINPTGKQQLLESMKQTYGVAADKYQFMLATHDLKYTNIQPDIKGMQISEKVEEAYKLLCNLFGVPLPLVRDDASTYNNIVEAKKFFYDTTIRYYAEVLLKVSQSLLTASSDFIPQDAINYKIENVPELETSLSAACKERGALLDYLLKLREAGEDVDQQISELVEDSKTLYRSV